MIGKIKSYDEDTQTGVIKSEDLFYEFHVNDWSESVSPVIDSDVLFEDEGETASMVTLIGSYLVHKEAVKSRKIAMTLAFFPLTGLFGGHRWYLGYYKIATFQIIVSVLTAGAGILWPIIDGVLLSTGNLDKDKQGRPLK
ncbi:MAG: NINE protein [Methyloprofundus sp.]|nr:NINE protein [Methyloprofundus sp.]